jgi:hypothetical protein
MGGARQQGDPASRLDQAPQSKVVPYLLDGPDVQAMLFEEPVNFFANDCTSRHQQNRMPGQLLKIVASSGR